jgi:predicted N-acetyltransferase YhbS
MMPPWRRYCDEKEGGMPRPITIRPAGTTEAEAVWRLTVEAYLPDRERLHPPSGVFRETVLDVQRAMDEGTVYVAQCGADIVGAVRVQPARDHDALYCGRLAVLPAARRRGIGTALMERVERHACEAGYPAVVLGVRLELPDNLRFYARRGYRIVGEESHPGYAAPTFAWLRKDLIADTTG